MKILAIDYGKSYIGLASGDTELLVSFPLDVVRNIDEVLAVLEEKNFDKIVIGLPLGFDGHESEQSANTRKFAKELSKKTNIEIEFFDERLSSREAERKMKEAGIYKTRDDAISASNFLQTYLEKNYA
jgi:putative Holliday junction resolvase